MAENSNTYKYDTCCGEEVIFVEQPEEKYLCTKCLRILTNPIFQTPCGHRLSKICLEELVKSADGMPCPAKEEGCEVVTKTNVHPDKANEREIMRLVRYCSWQPNGCDVTLPWNKMATHSKDCPFMVIQCSNPGCNVKKKASEIGIHMAKECVMLKLTCEDCADLITRKHLLNGHKQECKPKQLKCPLVSLGCVFIGFKDELDKHIQKEILHHMRLVAAKMSSTAKDIETLKLSFDQYAKIQQELQKYLDNFHASNTTPENEEMQKSIQRLTDEIEKLQVEVQSKVNQSSLNEVQNSLSSARDTLLTHERRITSMENNRNNSTSNNGSGNVEELTQQISRLETTVVALQDMRAQDNIRMRIMETACFEGKLLWKITDYERRKSDAVAGRTLSLYSQPFYSSVHGYKMCARVYLNGDGMGRGTHISLFFVVMKGEYDNLQKWPFRQKITLSILDQSRNRRDITDSFRPDPTSQSFAQPRKEMNIASGSPMFATHAQIENGEYVKDDTLFVKVTVDKTDLQDI